MAPLPAGHWALDVEKVYQGEYWTNRYIIAAADLAAAVNIGDSISTAEKVCLGSGVLLTRFRVSDGQPDTDVYQVKNLNVFGSKTVNGELLPLFNVARVDFNTEGGGRPSRKYLRGVLGEGDISFNTIIQAAVDYINQNYTTVLVTLAAFVDIDGQQITSGATYPFVGMRQLRRASKRKAITTNTTGT